MVMMIIIAHALVDQLGRQLVNDLDNPVGLEIIPLQVIRTSCHHIYSAHHPQPKMRRV